MTANNLMAMERPPIQFSSLNIDIPGVQTSCANSAGDHSLVPDTSMYASSPNSLFMYEQEKADMLNTLGMSGPNCQQQPQRPVSKARMIATGQLPQISEASLADELLSIENEDLFRGGYNTQVSSSLESYGEVPMNWENSNFDTLPEPSEIWNVNDYEKLGNVFQSAKVGVNGPTLAELNCDESLFEDLDPNLLECMLNGDMATTDWNNPDVPSARASPTTAITPTLNNTCTKKVILAAGSGFIKSEPVSKVSQLIGAAGPEGSVQKHSKCSAAAGRPPVVETVPVFVKKEQDVVCLQDSSCSSNNATDKKSPLKCLLVNKSTVPIVKTPIVKTEQAANTPPLHGTDLKWQQVRQFIHDEEPTFLPINTRNKGSRIRRQSNVSMDTESEADECSDYEDGGWLSDADSVDSWSSNKSLGKKSADRYFWQYNAQSKGPKGQRLHIPKDEKDPHVLTSFHDPVFDNEQPVVPIRHGGKARRGDGNDVCPNPRKLFQIGHELKKLNKTIESLTPSSDVPASVRNKTRREKNKLASRACRLKKKAQHEANKLKLFGLEGEHQQLMTVLTEIKTLITDRVLHPDQWEDKKLITHLDNLIKTYLSSMIAGHASDYVTSVLDKVSAGDLTGGIKRK
ncbi:uncharacterized protein LOC141898334 [Tubulanus polymorphus]|uniref:uncharacterized protein LOC141898334 n=1 Tax=Tubulanus polymorphus TaxID=672921 RepID=UPI003DA63AC8